MGGHAMYPKKRSVTATIYNEFVHIEKLDLKIPINSIEKIETEDARRITATE